MKYFGYSYFTCISCKKIINQSNIITGEYTMVIFLIHWLQLQNMYVQKQQNRLFSTYLCGLNWGSSLHFKSFIHLLGVIYHETISVMCCSQNNESFLRWAMWHLLIVTVTQRHFDLSVQIRVTYRSHVTGSNFARHTQTVPWVLEQCQF